MTPWTVARQVPLSMDFLGKNTGVGCYFPLQGILPESETKPSSPVSPALAARFFTTALREKPMGVRQDLNVTSARVGMGCQE